MKNLFITLSICFLNSIYISKAQPLIQKVLPPTSSHAVSFGDANGNHSALALDTNTLIVSDPLLGENSLSTEGKGAVIVYKKIDGKWVVGQTLNSDASDNFGANIAFKNNLLVVSSPNEEQAGIGKTGALYVYKRTDPKASFVLITKLFPVGAINETGFGATSVATNGLYIVSNGSDKSKLYIFKVETNSVKHVNTITTPNFSSGKFGLTTNNIAVLMGKNIKMFKIEGSTAAEIIRSDFQEIGPYNYYTGNIVVDGTTVVAEMTLSHYTVNYYYKVFKMDYNTVKSSTYITTIPYLQGFGGGATTMALKEDKWLFVNYPSTAYGHNKNQVVGFKYFNGNYFKAGTIEKLEDGNSSDTHFAGGLAITNNILAVADKSDKSLGNSTSGGIGTGAISLFSLEEDFISKIDWAARKCVNPLNDQNDNIGTDVALGNNYMLVSADDNDIDVGSGAVYLYKKVGGKWNFATKIIAPTTKALSQFGKAVDVSTKFAAIGAPTGVNKQGISTGAAMVYNVDSSIEPQFEQTTHPTYIYPDNNSTIAFGFDVAIDGNNLVVSAPKEDDRGVVYFYQWDGIDWVLKQKIAHADEIFGDLFGATIELKGEHLMIGSPLANGGGSVYIYRLEAGLFNFKKKFTGEPSSQLGHSISISYDYAVLGKGNGKGVQILKRAGGDWNLFTTLNLFSEPSTINAAVNGNSILISTNNDLGQAKLLRYQLMGTNWTRTGSAILGEATTYGAPVSMYGSEFSIAYKSDANTSKSYALINNFYNIPSNAREEVVENEIKEMSEAGSFTSQGMFVSPNPTTTNSIINIHVSEAEIVELTNVQGNDTQKFAVNANRCNISGLSKGVYLMRIVSKNEEKTGKLIVE